MNRFLLLFSFLSTCAFADQRSVVLITIDTLRADYVGYSGSKKVQTPALDELARHGVIFTNVRTPVPLTLPSHTSILTGLYPPAHGVRDNATYRLEENKTTLAEAFKKHGYNTAAFTSSFILDHRFGLSQGFDHYDDHVAQNASMAENQEAERKAEQTFSAFHEWLNTASDHHPYFVWLHFYDPHAPYTPPEKYAEQYPKDPYAGEVAYVDSVIAKVLKELQQKKVFANALIAVVGDHGEGLGEHNEKTHSILIYNSTLHVPMLLVAPRLIPENQTVTALCGTIDLAPSILDYAGFPESFGQGHTLRNLIEHKSSEGEEIYSESLYPKLNLGWSELKGFESGKYHFILAPKPELYDVKQDPAETKNIIAQNAAVAGQMKKKMESIFGTKEQSPQKLDAETTEKLRSLGYVSGTAVAAKNSNIDPNDRMDTWNQIQVGLLLFAEGRYELSSESFRKVAATEKNNPLVYDYLCSSQLRLEKWDAAEKCYLEALKNGIQSSAIYTSLGIADFNLRHYVEAKDVLERALRLDPLNVTAHYYLGNVSRARGELQSAADQYQQALKINPRYVFALNGLGMTYSSMKMNQEALNAFQKAIEADPKNPGTYYNLGVQLERMGRNPEAIKAFQTFLQMADTKEFVAQRDRAKAALERLQH